MALSDTRKALKTGDNMAGVKEGTEVDLTIYGRPLEDGIAKLVAAALKDPNSKAWGYWTGDAVLSVNLSDVVSSLGERYLAEGMSIEQGQLVMKVIKILVAHAGYKKTHHCRSTVGKTLDVHCPDWKSDLPLREIEEFGNLAIEVDLNDFFRKTRAEFHRKVAA